jgi:hypothetical protein
MNIIALLPHQKTKEELKAQDRKTKAAHADRGAIEYYLCVVFDSDTMCKEFIDKAGFTQVMDDQFLDGRILADRLGITLDTPVIIRKNSSTLSKKIIDIIAQQKGGDING